MVDDGPPDRRDAGAPDPTPVERDRRLLEQLLRPINHDAGETAAGLLGLHGSLGAVLAACHRSSTPRPEDRFLALVFEASRRSALGRLEERPVFGTSGATTDYLMIDMANLPIEHVRVLFLNTRNRLIADETIASGTIDKAAFYPREILKRALELHAASIILAHNHPSGDPTPSRQDVAVTQQIAEGGCTLGVALLDHLVLASTGWVSLRAKGFL